jgi:hypothetical protein
MGDAAVIMGMTITRELLMLSHGKWFMPDEGGEAEFLGLQQLTGGPLTSNTDQA